MFSLYARTVQFGYRKVSPFIAWRLPEVIQGEHALFQLPTWIEQRGFSRPLIITDEGILHHHLLDDWLVTMEDFQIYPVIYAKTVPNPPIIQVEEAAKLYREHRCDCLIAIGGGSPIDCAKAVGARVANPNRTIPEMKGELKVKRPIPPLIAVPTTAGTGSEGTLAAVISNPESQEKYALNDPKLIPVLAVLDPRLTLGLPAHLTATTGMDALTHAIEAYLGKSNTQETEEWSIEAVQLILKWLPIVYENPTHIEGRQAMQWASYIAGLAFTRAYVGYVHAASHQLSGFYGTPHGLANAVILPTVLRMYGQKIEKRMATLYTAVYPEATGNDAEKTERLIQQIEAMNEKMQIPTQLTGIQSQDIPELTRRALKEANPLYPVPVIWGKKEMTALFHHIQNTES